MEGKGDLTGIYSQKRGDLTGIYSQKRGDLTGIYSQKSHHLPYSHSLFTAHKSVTNIVPVQLYSSMIVLRCTILYNTTEI